MGWQTIANAPFERDIEVAVFDRGEAHPLAFPCRRSLDGWVNAKTRKVIILALTQMAKLVLREAESLDCRRLGKSVDKK
jgi:hypothetical protein